MEGDIFNIQEPLVYFDLPALQAIQWAISVKAEKIEDLQTGSEYTIYTLKQILYN